MRRFRITTVSFAVLAIAAVSAARQAGDQAPKVFTLSGEMLRGYQSVQRNLVEAAEKMPEEHYSFKPTADIRPFGELVAHAALQQFRMCSMLNGEPSKRKDEKEDTPRTKTEAIALLKASTTYCDPLITPMTDAVMPELTLLPHSESEHAEWALADPDDDWTVYRAHYKTAFLSHTGGTEADYQEHKHALGRGTIRSARTLWSFAAILATAGAIDLVRGRRRRGEPAAARRRAVHVALRAQQRGVQAGGPAAQLFEHFARQREPAQLLEVGRPRRFFDR